MDLCIGAIVQQSNSAMLLLFFRNKFEPVKVILMNFAEVNRGNAAYNIYYIKTAIQKSCYCAGQLCVRPDVLIRIPCEDG